MREICVTTFFLFMLFMSKAQDELILKSDTVPLSFQLKIKKKAADTIVYKAFGKEKILPASEVMAYRYKDSLWSFVRKTDREKYLVRNNVLLLKHLQPDIIMKKHEMKAAHMSRVKALPDYRARLPYKGRTKVLKKGRTVLLALHDDTTQSAILMPLKKISSDSLFFIADLYSRKKLYGVHIRDVRYIIFNLEESMVVKAVAASSFGLVGALIAEGILDENRKPAIILKESDWVLEKIVNE